MFDIELLALVALFFIFIYLFYQGVKLLMKYLVIAVASAIFPFVLIKFFGVDLALTWGTIIAFVFLGIFAYTIYLGLSFIEKIVKGIIRLFGGGKKEEEKEKKG